ncbi:MAG: mannitol dehydrogenase family protein [Pseudomonadota bacterium]
MHLGWGGFASAHLGTLLNDIAAPQKGDWGVSAVSMRSGNRRDELEPQDGLYTVTERRADGDHTQLVDVVKESLVAPEDPNAVIERMANPDTKVVTMTVTQQGYDLPSADQIASLDAPPTIHSCIIEAAKLRAERGVEPFTAVSLDNIPGNGDFLKRKLTEYAALTGDDSAAVLDQIATPNTMVDRITPAPTAEFKDEVEANLGARDEAAISAEPYRQLIIENVGDATTLPPLEDVPGVKFVDDVKPFEAAKIKMLNGSHMMMGALGRVAGFETVDQCMADQDMGAFTKRFMSEVAATIDPIPGTNMQVYADDLAERFSNPRMTDSVDRLANDTSKKVHPRLFDALTDSIKKGTPNDALSVAAAGWVRFVAGEAPGHATPRTSDEMTVGLTDTGRLYTVSDPRAAELQEIARANPENPDKLFDAVGLNLASFGAEGSAVRRKVIQALDTMNKDSALSAVRSVTMRLDELPTPQVVAADRGGDAPSTPGTEPPKPGPSR